MQGRVLQLLLLALAAACCIMGAFAVQCPTIGEVAITGCSECTTVNITRGPTPDDGLKQPDDDDVDDDDDSKRPVGTRRPGRNLLREGSSGGGRNKGRDNKGRGTDDKGRGKDDKGSKPGDKGRGRGKDDKVKDDKGRGRDKGRGGDVSKSRRNATALMPVCTACADGFVPTKDSGSFMLITGDGESLDYSIIDTDDYRLPVCGK